MDKITVMGYLTKDTYLNYLSDPHVTFSRQNLITGKICFQKTTVASKEILLINRSKSFYETVIFEVGLNNYHNFILLLLLFALVNDTIQYKCRQCKIRQQKKLRHLMLLTFFVRQIKTIRREIFIKTRKTCFQYLKKRLKTSLIKRIIKVQKCLEKSEPFYDKGRKFEKNYYKEQCRKICQVMKRAKNYCYSLSRTSRKIPKSYKKWVS